MSHEPLSIEEEIASWRRRLVAMVEQPPYVYRDTPQELIERRQRRLTTFVGFEESEVAAVETASGGCLPQAFRAYLREMGRAPGDLFCGSNLAGAHGFDELRSWAVELLAEFDSSLALAPDAVVYLFSQGYQFEYVLARGGEDGPVWRWVEGQSEPRLVAVTFRQRVRQELDLSERGDAASRKNGGYYLTLHPEGGATQTFPALASGDRPLDRSWFSRACDWLRGKG